MRRVPFFVWCIQLKRVGNIVRNVRKAVVGFWLVTCWTLAGCVGADVAELPDNEPHGQRSSAVSAATWTDGPWPFTVESGELTCIGPEDDPGVFVVTDQGDMFALNPSAIRMADQVGAIADLDPIWRWLDPDLPSAKVNVSPMIVYALTLC